MFGNMGNMAGMSKQAQRVQEKMEKAQEEIKSFVADGEAGGGLVKIQMNGNHEVLKVEIADSLFADGDKEMCEDLVSAAITDAIRRINEFSEKKMGQATQGMPIPPNFKFPGL